MTNKELIDKYFTAEQQAWLAKNGRKAEGSTSEEKMADLARQLFAAQVWSSVEDKKNLAKTIAMKDRSYDLESLATIAGYADRKEGDKTITAGTQFLDDYFNRDTDKTKRDLWRVSIKDAYGENGWENAKKVLQFAERDRMYAGIDKARRDILEGNAEGQGWTDWGASALYGLFAPRSKRAHLEGRTPGGREIAGDILSSALYAIPAGEIAKPAQVLTAKLPGVLSKVGEKAAGIGSQFVVPGAVYGMDKALGNETDLWDPTLAGLANMGVNKVLAPAIGRFGSVLSGKISSRLPKPLREALEGAQSPQQKARELIEDARRTIKEIMHPEKEYEDAFRHGVSSKGKWDRIQDAADILRVNSQADNLSNDVKRQLESATDFGRKTRANWNENSNAADMGLSPEDWLGREIAESLNPSLLPEQITKLGEKKYAPILEKHPELMTLFMREPALFSKNQPKRPTLEGILDGLMAFGVNKYGGDKTGANVAAQALTGGKVDPKEIRKDQQKARTRKRQASEAEQILKPRLEGLTGKDREYLQAIIDNPGLVQGYGNVTPEFRNWYLLRGQELLQDTKYFRPTPEVK